MPTIDTIDLHFQGVPQTIASYIVQSEQGLAMIETGPSTGIDHCVAGLKELGLKPSDIKHVLLTHIHFDHAGAAGWWAQQGAHIYVHHVGAPHLIDPSRLLRSAARIYGDQMDLLWGDILPIPTEQLTQLYDGDVIEVGELRFEALDTPGHANHHMTYKLGNIAFTGDAAGAGFAIRPGLVDFPAPPPEFHLEKWVETINRIRSHNFSTIYPTHFGAVSDPASHLTQLEALLHETTQLIGDWTATGLNRDEVMTRYIDWYDQRLANGRTKRRRDTAIQNSDTPLYGGRRHDALLAQEKRGGRNINHHTGIVSRLAF